MERKIGINDMENLKTYEQFVNEGVMSWIKPGSREGTKNIIGGRHKDDKYALRIFEDMKRDYEESGKNLKKVNIRSKLDVMTYHFGTTRWDAGNRKVGDKEVEINSVNFNGALMKITEWKVNPKHDPNFEGNPLRFEQDLIFFPQHNQEEKDKLRIYNEVEETFYISRDVSKKIIRYFVNEYNTKYPQLKKADSRNYFQIKEIEKGEKPTLGWVDCFSKNQVECIFDINDWKDKPKYEKWIRSNYAVKTKSKDGYPVTFCYEPHIKEISKELDPYGEEDWNDREQEIIEWLNTLTYTEIEQEIRKQLDKI
jgi:hypothetical protein